MLLHVGIAVLVLFWPAPTPKLPEPGRHLLVSGMVTLGKEGRSAPGAAQPIPEQNAGPVEKQAKPVEAPQEQENRTVAQVEAPSQPEPTPEIKPVEKPPEKPAPKPEPVPEATPIPKEPEKKSPPKEETPPKKVEPPKVEPKKPEPEKKEPPKKKTPKKEPEKKTVAKKEPEKKATPKKPAKKASLEDELLALRKQVEKQDGKSFQGSGKKRQSADDALAALRKELGGSGDDEQGDGPGGRGGDGIGVLGAYEEVIISRVKPRVSFTPPANRTVYHAKVHIQIAKDGTITNAQLVRPSGNVLYDSAVLRAVQLTDDLEPPPDPSLRDIEINFSSDQMLN